MANYLLEIGLEEMPAHLVSAASQQLATRVSDFLTENRVTFESVTKFSTPRRLAVLVNGLADASASIDEEVKAHQQKLPKMQKATGQKPSKVSHVVKVSHQMTWS